MDPAADEARQLLLAHTDRAATGRLDAPARVRPEVANALRAVRQRVRTSAR